MSEHDFGFRTDFYTFAPEDLAKQIPDFKILREVGNATYLAWVLNVLGDVRLAQGREEDARAVLEEALALAEEAGAADYALFARAQLARFRPESVPELREALAQPKTEGRDDGHRLHWYHLWCATREPADLERAHAALEDAIAAAPDEYKESLVEGNRLNRDIRAAWGSGPK